MGTQRYNDVVSTSMRRDHVASTLIRRHFDIVCLLGWYAVRTMRNERYACVCHVVVLHFRPENLKKGAIPVNNDDIVDLIQVNMFGKVGFGLYLL